MKFMTLVACFKIVDINTNLSLKKGLQGFGKSATLHSRNN